MTRTHTHHRLSAGFLAGVLVTVALSASAQEDAPATQPDNRVHAFYYTWYGNPETDGHWVHWDHQVILREGGGKNHRPPEDIGASFYPADGLYSSNSPTDVARHMQQMRAAGVGVVATTWWGVGDYTDKALPVVFDAAEAHGLKVCFHIEPFRGRNATTTREALVYLLDQYGEHPALYRLDGRPMVYLYDSYLSPAKDWATILDPDAENTIRGTKYDTFMIGLWVKEHEGPYMLDGHFDGFYTYFAVDGFTYGSTLENWPALAKWAKDQGKLFIPSVGPGYEDLRVRPWNTKNFRARENGAYYDRMFEAAFGAAAPLISITSFNEWHEGTQIEPAIPKAIPAKDGEAAYTYLDHENRSPEWYLERTAYWVTQWQKHGD